jgi:hypothetical protein
LDRSLCYFYSQGSPAKKETMMGVDGDGRRKRIWLAALAIALSWYSAAAAESSALLPRFTACIPAIPSELPTRWRAVGLMMPFLQGQLDVGEFVYVADHACHGLRAQDWRG